MTRCSCSDGMASRAGSCRCARPGPRGAGRRDVATRERARQPRRWAHARPPRPRGVAVVAMGTHIARRERSPPWGALFFYAEFVQLEGRFSRDLGAAPRRWPGPIAALPALAGTPSARAEEEDSSFKSLLWCTIQSGRNGAKGANRVGLSFG